MTLKLTNNATALLAGSIGESETELAVASGKGALFPTITEAGEWFPLTVIAADGSYEIMRVTARTGDVLTVTRAQEGTAARPFDAGARADLRLTAAAIADIIDDLEAITAAAVTDLEGKLSAAEGDSLLFPQPTAPLGWAQDTDVNDRVMRVVSGEGGGTGGSWIISGLDVGGTTLATTNLPPHPHLAGDLVGFGHIHGDGSLAAGSHDHGNVPANVAGNVPSSGGADRRGVHPTNKVNTSGSGSVDVFGVTGSSGVVIGGQTANAGGGTAHDHPISQDGAWRPAYLDCIRAVKEAA